MTSFWADRQFYYNTEKKEIFSSWKSGLENEKILKVGYRLQYRQAPYILQGDAIGRVTYNKFRPCYKVVNDKIEKI